jgi:hypothetical protein
VKKRLSPSYSLESLKSWTVGQPQPQPDRSGSFDPLSDDIRIVPAEHMGSFSKIVMRSLWQAAIDRLIVDLEKQPVIRHDNGCLFDHSLLAELAAASQAADEFGVVSTEIIQRGAKLIPQRATP